MDTVVKYAIQTSYRRSRVAAHARTHKHARMLYLWIEQHGVLYRLRGGQVTGDQALQEAMSVFSDNSQQPPAAQMNHSRRLITHYIPDAAEGEQRNASGRSKPKHPAGGSHFRYYAITHSLIIFIGPRTVLPARDPERSCTTTSPYAFL